VDFLAARPLWHATPALLFVHAGIRPGVAIEAQEEDDLVWIRDEFLYDTSDHGRLVVHGHTALQTPTHFGNRVDLDAGAGYGRPLAVAVFEERQAFVLTKTGRERLRPV
jgi:serine/threonine protein phosphatase 1